MSRKKETKLFSFSVLLNEDGDVVVEKQGLDPKAFKEAMDDWNDEYQKTHTLVALIHFLNTMSEELSRDVSRVIH